jgi:aspartate/methionine/tyrosine aminotransferase
MQIINSNAKFSSIVDIGIKLKSKFDETQLPFLPSHRGINSVTAINIDKIAKKMNFNSPEIQNYPPVEGIWKLRNQINNHYFENTANSNNIFISIGSVLSLNITFSILNINEVLLPQFFWGAYAAILKINKLKFSTYSDFDFLLENKEKLKNKAVIICEPSNPLGTCESDNKILNLIAELDKNDIISIVDSPYRRVFHSDIDFYKKMLNFNNIILLESFSKYLGLSGQRIGFLYCNNKEFNEEFRIKLLYATNGVNAFAQNLVFELLSTPQGKQVIADFLNSTTQAIQKNILFLQENNLLATDFYQNSMPIGIFAVVNKSQDLLFEKNIGAVSLSFFHQDKQKYKDFSRICVSLDNQLFKSFFSKAFL